MPEVFWTVEQLAERWQTNERTVMIMVATRGVPHIAIGRRSEQVGKRGPKQLRFRPHAIEAWEATQERNVEVVSHFPEHAAISPESMEKIREETARRMGWDGIRRLTKPKPRKRPDGE